MNASISPAVWGDSVARAGKFGAWHCDSCDAPRNYERMYCARCEETTGSYTFDLEGEQVPDMSTVMRYALDAKHRAAMDAEAQTQRDIANAAIDLGLRQYRERKGCEF